MKLAVSFIDFSELDRRGDWRIKAVALRDMHHQLDSHAHLRQMLGEALAPPPTAVVPLGSGIVAVLGRPA